MSEYLWTELRRRAIELYLDTPSAVVEQRVLDVFHEHPALVAEAIEHVGRRFQAGQVRSPWAILAKHVEEALRPLEDASASDERDREKAIRRVEAWIRAAGKHFDRWSEVEDELFGELGRLRAFDEPALRERMAKLWRELHPEGELIEQQALERAQRWRDTVGSRRTTRPLVIVPDADPEPVLVDDDPEPLLA